MWPFGGSSSSVTQDEHRSIYFNTEVPNVGFCNNKIRTSLYVGGLFSPIYFLVQGVIIEEFSKKANFYFLVRPRRHPSPDPRMHPLPPLLSLPQRRPACDRACAAARATE